MCGLQKGGRGGEVSRDVIVGMGQGLSSPSKMVPPPHPPLVCVSPAKAKLKAFATCIHIQLKAPLCGGAETAAETPGCLFSSVAVEKVAARLPSEVYAPLTHTETH